MILFLTDVKLCPPYYEIYTGLRCLKTGAEDISEP